MLDIYECDRMLYPPEVEPEESEYLCPLCRQPIYFGEEVLATKIGDVESVCHNDCVSTDMRDFIEVIGGEIRVFELYREDYV